MLTSFRSKRGKGPLIAAQVLQHGPRGKHNVITNTAAGTVVPVNLNILMAKS